jgi:hypothetical protein
MHLDGGLKMHVDGGLVCQPDVALGAAGPLRAWLSGPACAQGRAEEGEALLRRALALPDPGPPERLEPFSSEEDSSDHVPSDSSEDSEVRSPPAPARPARTAAPQLRLAQAQSGCALSHCTSG